MRNFNYFLRYQEKQLLKQKYCFKNLQKYGTKKPRKIDDVSSVRISFK